MLLLKPSKLTPDVSREYLQLYIDKVLVGDQLPLVSTRPAVNLPLEELHSVGLIIK